MTMLGSSVYDDIDDNEPPPGFGPMRAQQALCGYGTAPAYRPSSTTQPPHADQYHSTNQQYVHQIRPEGAAVVGAGAARQFHKALSGSIADVRNQARKQQPTCPSSRQVQAPSPEPDYGDCADSDSDYGYGTNRRTSNRHSGGHRPHTRNHPCSSPYSSSPSADWPASQKLQERRGSQSPAAATQKCWHNHHHHQQQHNSSPSKSPAPDYGEYADADDYGSDAVTAGGGRGRRGNAAKTDAGSPARKQAQHKSNNKSSRGRHSRSGGSRSSKPDTSSGQSHEQASKLAAKLEVLQIALQEAEARQVEAQMTVITLETDNSTLQAQLQDLRRQKQQLEMMLLLGGDSNSRDSPYDGEDYSGGYSDTAEDNGVDEIGERNEEVQAAVGDGDLQLTH